MIPGFVLYAVTVYYSFPPYSGWDVLGVLTADAPSAIFRTNWPSTPEFAASPVVQARSSNSLGEMCSIVFTFSLLYPLTPQIGLSIESADVVSNLKQVLVAKEQDKLGFAYLVAGDLFKSITPCWWCGLAD